MRSQYSYPARIDRDEEGRYQVRFADLPDALTDGADPAEALTEAVDCLSAAIASRIIDGETIPKPSPLAPGQQLVSPDPTIALKAALYAALQRRDMTVADLAHVLGMGDWHQAARLIDPKRSTKLTTLMAALDALRCQVEIAINDVFVPEDPRDIGASGKKWTAAFRLDDDKPPPARHSDAAPRNEHRRQSPLLLPEAHARSAAAIPERPPTAKRLARIGQELRAEPGGRSRRKSKARSPD
jgi:predicted RNase H-like HicB family nuclease